MKHMIYTRPKPEKQLSNFLMNEQLSAMIDGWIESKLDDISLLMIQSDPGNGSSHLLHAIANELRKIGIRSTFLQFRKTDSLSDLSTYHVDDVLKSNYVFIDHIEALLNHSPEWPETESFLIKLATNNCKLICTIPLDQEIMIRSVLSIPFSNKPAVIKLSSISPSDRIEWAKVLMEGEDIQHLPDELYHAEVSNGAFVESIQPFILEMKLRKGNAHSFMQEYGDQLNICRLAIRQIQLALAELEIEKTTCIRLQQYEKAAEIRGREKDLFVKRVEMWSRIKKMYDDLPFTPGLIDLHYRSITLMNELEVKNIALRSLNKRMNKHLTELEEQWEHIKENNETPSNRSVIEELRDWQHAIERFNVNNKNNNKMWGNP
ncbi:MAG: UvrB/UvrC motif-containing protein [Flavobacteriia bacterium]